MSESPEQNTSAPEPSEPLTGGCLCGGVRYEISGPLGPIVFCHCSMCRKVNGSAFATNALLQRAHFRLLRGADLIAQYESSAQKWRCFCRVCGAPIYSHTTRDPQTVRIRIGLLDRHPGGVPVAHFMPEFRAPWYQIADDLPFLDSKTGQPLPDVARQRIARAQS